MPEGGTKLSPDYATEDCEFTPPFAGPKFLSTRFGKGFDMTWRCVVKHDWDGCLCRRCGNTRDRHHDWEHCHCRRCNLNRHGHHKWEGCRCAFCGRERHKWNSGVCTKCGKQCSHQTQLLYPDDPYDTSATAHIRRPTRCQSCGMLI